MFHLGTDANTGHYICAVRKFQTKDSEWVVYDDHKVSTCDSEKIPWSSAYLLLYVQYDQ